MFRNIMAGKAKNTQEHKVPSQGVVSALETALKDENLPNKEALILFLSTIKLGEGESLSPEQFAELQKLMQEPEKKEEEKKRFAEIGADLFSNIKGKKGEEKSLKLADVVSGLKRERKTPFDSL